MSNGLPLFCTPIHQIGNYFHRRRINSTRDEGTLSGRPPICPTTDRGGPKTHERQLVAPNPTASIVQVIVTPATPNMPTAERPAFDRQPSGNENHLAAGRYRFSRPINWRMLASPTVGVRKQKPQSPTRPVEFAFKSVHRASLRRCANRKEESRSEMRKRMVPSIHPYKKVKPFQLVHDPTRLTVPESPKFHVQRRLLERQQSCNRDADS